MAENANVELEVKLTLEPDALARARAVLEDQAGGTAGESVTLRNIYFDTPDFALNWQRMALRVRQKGSRFIQTLKTQGEFIDGGHRRMEWEWPLATAELDLSLLAATPLSGQADLNQLQPAFETNFERQVLMITEFGSGGDALAGGDALVEVAIDQGRILGGGRASPLCEIEFELKSGNPAVLRKLAVELAAAVPVFLNVISKAEQGYHLAGVTSAAPDIAGISSVYGFFRCLSACWLREEPFPLGTADLSRVRQAAEAAGVSADFEKLVPQLSSDQPVNALIADGLLGRVQLAIAGAEGF
jgi:inorganic triphosphatase YgiF